MTTRDLRQLRKAARLRERSANLLAQSDAILVAELPKLVADGMPLTEIAREVGVSRPKLYKLLAEAGISGSRPGT